ncbi:MAG: fimV [Burkholderia sp.]|nr:fimV [Burkholderia sp.]
MPKKTTEKACRKPRSTAWKALGAAVVSAAMLGSAGAAGLGQLTVLSSLGQPLLAEIELTSVSRDEAGNLSVKLAPASAFRQANIEYNPALANLRFAIEQRGSRQIVRITSSQPVNEPFVDVLLEVNSNGSRLLREYVVLLDPAGTRRAQPAETAAAPAPAANAANPAAAAPAAPARRQAPAAPATPSPAAAPASESGAAGNSYAVKRGDTLAEIAGQVKPEGVSLDQMLVAMQRANPNAFVGNNINRLRSGQILAVPAADAARAVPSGEARRIVVAQSADFNNYRNRLAGQVAGAGSSQGEGGQLASGKITAKVEEQRNPAGESRDRLQVSRSGAPAGADAEERIAQEKALAEANSRVKELEKTVSDLQRLLEVRNRDLAAKQNQAASPAAVAAAGTGGATATPAAPAAATPAPAAETAPAAAAVAAPTPAATPAQTAPAAAEPAPPKPAKPRPVVVTPAPAEPGLLEELTSNPAVLGGSALLVALLAALGITRSRKARKAQAIGGSSILPTSTLKTNTLFGTAGGQSVDTSNSVFNSNFSPSASQLDTNEVDPVAEADVYIAYGRDAQAEEILKEALRTQPDRTAVRGKLLEIYSSRKDLRAFETTATELFSLTRGEGDEWAQAATLGSALDPTNPLYASAKKPADEPVAGEAAGAMATAAIGAAALAATHEVVRDDHANDLDFDGLLSTTTQSDEPHHDLNLDDTPAPSETPVAEAKAKAETETPATEDLVVPDLANELPPVAAATQPAPTEPEPASNLLDFDFDLDSFGKTTPPAAPVEPTLADHADSRLMDFKLDDDEPAPAAPAADQAEEEPFALLDPEVPAAHVPAPIEAPMVEQPVPVDFDLSGISLDLDAHGAGSEALQDVPTLGEHVYSNTAEMATKLDLASAYQEIGDREGARELLEEVIRGGDTEQSEKARGLLQKLA